MTTTLQIAMIAGALVGLGLSMLVWRFRPAQVDLATALDRLSPDRSLSAQDEGTVEAGAAEGDARDKLGRWAMRTLPLDSLGAPPYRELALMRIPVHRFYGEKVVFALLGAFIPVMLLTVLSFFGFGLPWIITPLASAGGAVGLFFLPDYNVKDDAKAARKEFGRALASYIDLVALERNSGSGPRQAMEIAANIGDSWVFRRLAEELSRSRWSGLPPWDALRKLSDELGLPELADLAGKAAVANSKLAYARFCEVFGDEVFGPNLGGAEVLTATRAGLAKDCPNLGRFLANLTFTLPMENEVMGRILNDGQEPGRAAGDWLRENPQAVTGWLDGVTTADGGDAAAAVTEALAE